MSIISRECASLVSNSGQQLVWPNCDTKARYGKEGTGRQVTGIHAPCDRPIAPVHVFECVYGLKNNTQITLKKLHSLHCSLKKLTYFSRLRQVAELLNTALPENWLFIKSNNRFANSQYKLIINAVSVVSEVRAGGLR